ncbi:hypothetical protein IWW36_004424, partial [Coemansia brasiliensis]
SGHPSASVSSTPAKKQEAKDMAEAHENEKAKRREWLCSYLLADASELSFEALIKKLGCGVDFKQFRDQFLTLFSAMAYRSMAYSKKAIVQPEMAGIVLKMLEMKLKAAGSSVTVERQLGNLGAAELLLCAGRKNESGLVDYFGELFSVVKLAMFEVPGNKQWVENISQYEGLEHQAKPITGGKHKIDFAIHYERHSKMDLASVHIPIEAKSEAHGSISTNFGQLADYGYALWSCQPTRLFAPVLYLHGCEIRLLIFTRGGCRWVDLGQYCFSTDKPKPLEAKMIRDSLCRLFFLLSLPSDRFGHYCDVSSNNPTSFWFSRQLDSTEDCKVSAITSADIIRQQEKSSVDIGKGKKLERTINPRGRFAHVYKLAYCGQPAVLKISWTPTNRLPECAVYDALARAKVDHVPKVFDSGLVCEESFGYRVEFLLIQDCGVSLAEYLKRSGNSIEEQCNMAASAMLDIAICLKQAWSYGIIHRDISAGNIALRNGRATVIDWGYAKLLDKGSGIIDDLAKRWRFEVDQVVDNEDNHDPITGTPLYMSIPVLVGAKKRSVVDDIESALYVVLDAVRMIQGDLLVPKPIALNFKDNHTLAFVRACCFSLIKECLPQFGIQRCSSTFDRLLTVVHEFLFMRGDYIGSYLAMVPTFERTVDDKSLDSLLSEMEKLLPDRPNRQSTTEPISSIVSGVKRAELSDLEPAKGQTGYPKRARKFTEEENS